MIEILTSFLCLIFLFSLMALWFVCRSERKKEKEIETIKQKLNDLEYKIEDHVVELADVCSTRLISKL